jgi:glucan 1,4-alpha-glucosidase
MKSCKLVFCFLFVFFLHSASAQSIESVQMGKVKLSFMIADGGTPAYAVSFDGKPVILLSKLGFVLDADSSFYRGFSLAGVEKSDANAVWETVWGESRFIRNQYHQLVVHLVKGGGVGSGATRRWLDIVFRVFADGVGFRYVFPKQADLKYFVVGDERTEFRLAGDHKTFWIPGDYDSNEYPYTTSKISEIDNRALVAASTDIAVRVAPDPYAVQTPLMMKSTEGLYLNIHEAGLVGYSSMQLHVDRATKTLTSALVPDAVGNKAYLHARFSTPWRTVIVSDKATDILSSRMILNLNEPSKIGKTDWIHPMKFVGVWWEMQTGKGTWSYSDFADSVAGGTAGSGTAGGGTAGGMAGGGSLVPSGKHSANTANVKRYIDFAARNHIDGVLVEGWNVGWEDWFGNWKENVFDFVTPYPDFNIAEITSYAASKGVHMIMHNETSGSATNYERQLDTAYKYMTRWGYHSVKTGYVGKIIPRGEHHDGQWMVDHYVRVAEKAAQYGVMLDAHEPVRPTGLQRTYPNWLACEASRGNEYNAFSNGNAPEHETILPFTRLMGGPMDYTPGIFRLRGYSPVVGRQVHTTLAKQLALYVTLYSPLQMAADLPENYDAHMDAFQFIRDVPVDWEESRILEAEPGDYITIARKEKAKENWYLGAITDENSRMVDVPLNFLDKGKKYTMTVYKDGLDADWKKNPEAYVIEKTTVGSDSRLKVRLAPGGGAAVSITAL